MNPLNKITRRLLAYLFRGMLISVPLAVTIYVIYSTFNAIDHLIPTKIYGKEIPGIGFLFLAGIFIVLGWLGGTFIAQPIIKYFNRLLNQVPLVKTLYNSVKDMLSAFVGQKKSFNIPVLVRLHEQYEVEQLGFVTAEDLSTMGIEGDKVAVYMPYSYSVAGVVYIVPRKNIKVINHRAPDVMKFILSGGVSAFEKHKPKEEHA